MTKSSLPLSILRRVLPILVATLAAYAWFAVRYQFAHMDQLFFQNSWQGTQALVFYLVGDYDRAAKAYRSHFAETAQHNEWSTQPSEIAILRGDYSTARGLARARLEQNPNDRDALLDLAQVAVAESDFRHADEFLERILQKDTDDADALVLSSLAAARSRDYNKAIDALNRTLRNSQAGSRLSSFLTLLETTGDLADLSRDERPYCLLALYARYLRVYDPSNGRLAIRYAKKAIRGGDRPEDAYLTIGVVYDKEGRKQKALQAFESAVEANPQYALASWWASFAYGKLGDLSNEYLMSKAAAQAAPKDPFYTKHLTYVLLDKLGDIHQAVTYLEAAVASNPGDAELHGKLGYAYDFIGNYHEAVTQYREAVHLNSREPLHYENLAHTLTRAGKYDEAIAVLKQTSTTFPSRSEPHRQLGDLYKDRFKVTEALHEYEETLRLGEPAANLCKAYQMASKLEQSAECFQNILDHDPSNQYAQRNLPEVLEALNYQRSKR